MDVTVLPVAETSAKPGSPLLKVMSERLIKLASEMEQQLSLEFNQIESGDLVIYLSYNSKYTVRWKIVNDVPELVHKIVAGYCASKGFVAWKELDLYGFKSIRLR